MKTRIEKSLEFLAVTICVLFVNGFIISWIGSLYPDGKTIFGVEYPIEFFTYGLIFAIFGVILYIFFPRKKRDLEKVQRL